ncbi:hypothetical protein [Cyclobacterium xiamenense]|uniref:hypothetical protein n=1 Tax=Cyclobacterium xiamenense TaxID=1297121 RepID=UPI0035CF2657
MKTSPFYKCWLGVAILCYACTVQAQQLLVPQANRHKDEPFLQRYSIRYSVDPVGVLKKVGADRNGRIQVLAESGLLTTQGGAFLNPGRLVPDRLIPYMDNMSVADFLILQKQFVYLDEKAVFSNSWAGTLHVPHPLPAASLMAAGRAFHFMVSDGRSLAFTDESQTLWRGSSPEPILAIKYESERDLFWILSSQTLFTFAPAEKRLHVVFRGKDFTAIDWLPGSTDIVLGTEDGYLRVDRSTGEQIGGIRRDLPVNRIHLVKAVNGSLWFGSPKGAFMLRGDGGFDYYYGKRWIPDNEVMDIAAGPEGSVLLLTRQGLGQICFKKMTLHEKALFLEDQVRSRHIRFGINSILQDMEPGDVSTGSLYSASNDGLWTAMYLASQAFRYAVTAEPEALQNCRESLEAMERLYTIHPLPGFPARTFERVSQLRNQESKWEWHSGTHSEWNWRGTTSSDEVIGHVFGLGVLAEVVDEADLRQTAIGLIEQLMDHIVANDFYLVGKDGQPTTWGKWNPDYVNGLPPMVGDRKLNSSNIVAMLQTAYRFTGKEIYRQKAYWLMKEQGYLKNLMRPMNAIGRAGEGSDPLAILLSESWNHSDDQMYFAGYWGLYRYAFHDSLRVKFRQAILDHWKFEKPERQATLNMFALLADPETDASDALWVLREHPLDFIRWNVANSHRNDLRFLEENPRNQTTETVLPPAERPVLRNNKNLFILDETRQNGTSEYSAADIWLLPYWMGRYLGLITPPH